MHSSFAKVILFLFLLNSVYANYTFETISVEGVDVLAVTAINDFHNYAGYAQIEFGGNIVAFTLIDGVFEFYEFPDSQRTFFHTLGNDNIAAGFYEAADGSHHGIVLENGELRQWDFPASKQTAIFGYSDSNGDFTGSFVDIDDITYGFSGNAIIEFPGASETLAFATDIESTVVGGYRTEDGYARAYVSFIDGVFGELVIEDVGNDLEYLQFQTLNDDMGYVIIRFKLQNDVPRSVVGSLFRLVELTQETGAEYVEINGRRVARIVIPLDSLLSILTELKHPDSVFTEAYDINEYGSIAGYYESTDGRILGFTARAEIITSVESNPNFATVWGDVKTSHIGDE